jgi:hypothetical protein
MGTKYNPSIVRNGLVYYIDAANSRSYSGSGITAYELKLSGIGGTLVNGVGFSSANNGSFIFDGTNDYIQIPVSYIPSGNEVSVCLWNFGTTAQTSSVFSAHSADEFRTINIHLPWNDNVVYWDAGFSAGTYDRINTATLTNTQWQGWHHWAFIKNATTGVMELYLDGVLNVSGTSKTRTMPTPSQAFIGRFQISSPLYHIGRVSLLHLYNRALTAQEVLQNYNATKKRYI